MIVGILKEIKTKENRVSMTPAGVDIMKQHGHTVLVEKNAGAGSGFVDEVYIQAGAKIIEAPAEIYQKAEMIMHVKEPLPSEYRLIKKNHVIFTYLHLAASRELTENLIKSGAVCIAYETVQKKDGSLPLLTPMSEVAGKMAVHEGAKYLEKTYGGKGKLLGGVPGVDCGTVLVIGGGTVGINAAKIACGLGARVYLLDTSLERLRYLSDVMPANCFPVFSSPANIRRYLADADLVVGAVLIPGATAPRLITREMLKLIKRGSVIVDVAIDQGGCVETSRPTTHDDPIYEVDGVIHYCVANMPGAVSMTSTIALTNATLPYAVEIANKGWKKAFTENQELRLGANIVNKKVTYRGVAEAFGLKFSPIDQLL